MLRLGDARVLAALVGVLLCQLSHVESIGSRSSSVTSTTTSSHHPPLSFPRKSWDSERSMGGVMLYPEQQELLSQLLEPPRGGAGVSKKKKDDATTILGVPKTVVGWTVAAVAVSTGLWTTRDLWRPYMLTKDMIQSKTLDLLHRLDKLPTLQSYAVYACGMMLWEMLGLSTIPVETAAGMVFGWDALVLSGMGKVVGAYVAFWIGRYSPAAKWTEKTLRLDDNEFLQLIQQNASSNPLLTVLLMKMSCFPEPIKNVGSAIIRPIADWMFLLATSLHGGLFTSLWTYVGVDTALRLEDVNGLLPTNRRLQVLLALALFNGCVVSPVSMGYWMKRLRASSNNKQKRK